LDTLRVDAQPSENKSLAVVKGHFQNALPGHSCRAPKRFARTWPTLRPDAAFLPAPPPWIGDAMRAPPTPPVGQPQSGGRCEMGGASRR